MADIPKLKEIRIPKCYKPEGFGKVVNTEVHHFADASFSRIGACSYIKTINGSDRMYSQLLMAKSRVVPSKGRVTIPRLELQAALVATLLSRTLKKELDIHIDEDNYWSDSKMLKGSIFMCQTVFTENTD